VEAAGISVTLVKPAAIDTPFPDHARNFMDQPPRLPQPLYTPDVVADAVLFACAHPRRTVYAGGGGLVSVLLARLAPRLTDRVMEAAGARAQQRPGDPGDPARRDNLHAPRGDALRGSRPLRARGSSSLLQVQKRPIATLAAGLVATGAVLAVRRLTGRR
jgi:hypothetical protein